MMQLLDRIQAQCKARPRKLTQGESQGPTNTHACQDPTLSWRIVVEPVGSSCDYSELRLDLSRDSTLV
jgi:hypothetical protein